MTSLFSNMTQLLTSSTQSILMKTTHSWSNKPRSSSSKNSLKRSFRHLLKSMKNLKGSGAKRVITIHFSTAIQSGLKRLQTLFNRLRKWPRLLKIRIASIFKRILPRKILLLRLQMHRMTTIRGKLRSLIDLFKRNGSKRLMWEQRLRMRDNSRRRKSPFWIKRLRKSRKNWQKRKSFTRIRSSSLAASKTKSFTNASKSKVSWKSYSRRTLCSISIQSRFAELRKIWTKRKLNSNSTSRSSTVRLVSSKKKWMKTCRSKTLLKN